MLLDTVNTFINNQKQNYTHMQFAKHDIDWTMPKQDLFDWIQNESNWPTLKMNTPFPLEDVKQELLQLDKYWVPHRDNDSDGWESMCIHGQSADHTSGWTDELPDYYWTEISNECPLTVQWLQDVWTFRGYDRVRFMKLKPGGYIAPHQDKPQRKLSAFNISIHEPEGHEFAQDDAGLVPWQEGDIRMIDIGRLHSLRNTGTEDRVHMIIHGQYSGKTVQDIIDSFRIESNKELDKQSK